MDESTNNSINDLACNSITIQQQEDIGYARIFTIPAGAQVHIDNIPSVLTTPVTLPISSGIHTYKLTYPGYIDVNGILFITTGQTYEISIILEKSLSDPIIYFLLFFGAGLFMFFLTKKSEKYEEFEEFKKIK